MIPAMLPDTTLTMTPAMMDAWKRLRLLLSRAFTRSELERLASEIHPELDVVSALPGPAASKVEVVEAWLDFLRRNGVLDDEFFRRTMDERGNLSDSMRDIQQTLRPAHQDRFPGAMVGGRYRLDAWEGSGGFGEVWRAFDEGSPVPSQEVAIKFLKSNLARYAEIRPQFLAGVETMRAKRLPGVVEILDGPALHEGQPYFVMEYLRGGNLEGVVQPDKGKIQRTGLMLLRDILAIGRAVALLHAADLIHRDIKPSNILFDERGECRLSDIDLVTSRRLPRGTFALQPRAPYAAPEQLRGGRRPGDIVDDRTDVYGLAMTAVYCLRGSEPASSGTYALDETLPCGPKVHTVLFRALTGSRERRPTMSQFCNELEQALSTDLVVLAALDQTSERTRHWGRALIDGMTETFSALVPPVEVVPLDDRGDPQAARDLVQEVEVHLQQRSVLAVVGPVCTRCTDAAMRGYGALLEGRVDALHLLPVATGSHLLEHGLLGVYRMPPDNREQARCITQAVERMGLQEQGPVVVAVGQGDAYVMDLCDNLRFQVRHRGWRWDMLSDEDLAIIAGKKPSIVVVVGPWQADTGRSARRFLEDWRKESVVTAKVLLTDYAVLDAVRTQTELLQDVICSFQIKPPKEAPREGTWFMHDYGRDTALLIREAWKPSHKGVRRALEDRGTIEGLANDYKFTHNGDNGAGRFHLYRIEPTLDGRAIFRHLGGEGCPCPYPAAVEGGAKHGPDALPTARTSETV